MSPQVEADGPLRVVDFGVCSTPGESISFGAIIGNTGDETLTDVAIEVEIENAMGNDQSETLPDVIHLLRPGQRMGIGDELPMLVAVDIEGFRLRVEATDDASRALPEGEITVADVSTDVDDIEMGLERRAEQTTTFSVTSTYDLAFLGLDVYIVYRNAAGDIVGGESDSVSGRLDAQSTASYTTTSISVDRNVTETDVYINADPALASSLEINVDP